MTSAAHALAGLGAVVLLSSLLAAGADAQVVDTTKVRPPVRPDSVQTAPAGVAPPRARPRPSAEPLGGPGRRPPITPRRAFLYSLMLPGLGQSRLNRGTAGALFAAVELGSFAMIRKSGVDLRQSRRYSGDSLPGNYTVQPNGTITGLTIEPPQFTDDLVRTRRLHTEDWWAAILFNHLLSGADAFVAAQLWDVEPAVAVRPYQHGVALVATIRF